MLNGYHYTGPLPLGSVVAHNCGAAGLFSSNTDADVKLSAVEYDDMYIETFIGGCRDDGNNHCLLA